MWLLVSTGLLAISLFCWAIVLIDVVGIVWSCLNTPASQRVQSRVLPLATDALGAAFVACIFTAFALHAFGWV
jgi:hypothetical protein